MENILKKLLITLMFILSLTLVGCSSEESFATPKEEAFGPHVRPDDYIFPNYNENLTIPEENNLVIPEYTIGANFKTYMYKNESNLSIDDYTFEDSNIYKSYDWNKANFGYGVSLNTIFLYEHLIVLPTAGTYEFFVKANGDVRVYVSTNYTDYHLVANDNFTTNKYDYYNENSFFKLKLKENQPFSIKVMLNTSTRADFAIGLINENGHIADISNNYVAMFN